MITSDEIKRRLWDGANELRGSMDASRYKDYMLGLMFYKFLSDKTIDTFRTILGMGSASKEEVIEEYKKSHEEQGQDVESLLQGVLGYYVLPEYLYQTWIRDINAGEFEVQKVTDSLNNFERTITGIGDSNDFKGLFSSSTLDLSDTALGSNLNERSKNIKALILLFADLDMVSLQKGDVLGDAYEYLIGQFAMESGKKAGEFYTPRQVSEVMARMVAKTSSIKSIYDPTVGSGSLLLTVKKHLSLDEQKKLKYYGQEKNTATYNLTRMNLLLHGVKPENMTIKNGDTLAEDWPEDPERPDEGILFDAVVMNPPYSAKNWNRAGLKVSDPRFQIAGVLPPESKGDFAFLLHGLFHLGTSGTMAIVLPHGVLFRGASEGEIRKRLLEKNYIDTIIGMPSNLFTNTGIPVVVIILKKNRRLEDPVLVIDASHNFVKIGKQNVLQEKDIAKIVDTYVNRLEEEGYSHLASRKEIVENEYNMNIPRYVSSIDNEIPHDVDAHLLGGIPLKNIEDLKILQAVVPDILNHAIEPIREGYVDLKKDIDTLTEEVLESESVKKHICEIERMTKEYTQKYWGVLREVNKETDLTKLREEMLEEIKVLLSQFKYLDTYDGYQVVAEIWKNSLYHDTELIAAADFYSIGRSRVPHMVTKGSGKNKRLEQEGWDGSIIPNELIEKKLFAPSLEEIEKIKISIQELDTELSELVEAAKEEETDENAALYDALKKDSEDEPGDTFDNKALKEEIKNADKTSEKYKLLKKVEKLIGDKSKNNKELKAKEKELTDSVHERIAQLTDEEIDELVFEKWFGEAINSMILLAQEPLKKELAILKELQDRYKDTLADLDAETLVLEKEFEALASQLVVTE